MHSMLCDMQGTCAHILYNGILHMCAYIRRGKLHLKHFLLKTLSEHLLLFCACDLCDLDNTNDLLWQPKVQVRQYVYPSTAQFNPVYRMNHYLRWKMQALTMCE